MNNRTTRFAVPWAVFCVVILAGVGLKATAGQEKPQMPPVEAENIRGGLYLVRGGSGAHAAFYVSDAGVLLIDAKMTPESGAAMAAAAKAVAEPLHAVVLTHSDGDHINGLPGFPKGLPIIAHEETKTDVEAAADGLPALKDYIPTRTFTSSLDLEPEGFNVRLLNFGPAHTSGDAVVFFPEERAAFVGDLIFIGRDPLIHRHKGGNSFGLVKTLKALTELDADVYLSGHADPVSKSDVEDILRSIEDRQAKVKTLVEAGKTLDEVKEAFGIEDAPGRRWPSLVEIIYLELTEN